MIQSPWFDISQEINKIFLMNGPHLYELRDVERDLILKVDCFLTYHRTYVKKFYIAEKIVDQNNNLILIPEKVEHLSYD